MDRDYVLLTPPINYDWEGEESANVRLIATPSNFWDLMRAYMQHHFGWNKGEYIELEVFEVVTDKNEAQFALCEVAGSVATLVPIKSLGNERIKHYLKRRKIVKTIEFSIV